MYWRSFLKITRLAWCLIFMGFIPVMISSTEPWTGLESYQINQHRIVTKNSNIRNFKSKFLTSVACVHTTHHPPQPQKKTQPPTQWEEINKLLIYSQHGLPGTVHMCICKHAGLVAPKTTNLTNNNNKKDIIYFFILLLLVQGVRSKES